MTEMNTAYTQQSYITSGEISSIALTSSKANTGNDPIFIDVDMDVPIFDIRRYVQIRVIVDLRKSEEGIVRRLLRATEILRPFA